MNVLVVGGAGYIGSHAARALAAAGHKVVILDNLSAGHREAVERLRLPLIVADLSNPTDLADAFGSAAFDVVVHFAALAYVGESVLEPARYYANNVVGTFHLLEAMRKANVRRMVFSSTCATYGIPETDAIDETHPQRPINPYGRGKLAVEWMLQDYATAYGLRHVTLRYFNAAGASVDGLLGEDHDPETHLIPLCLMAAAGSIPHLTVHGTDYPTPDGTCIRDYVHVEDLAAAHVLAGEHLAADGDSLQLNVGTERGHSIRDVLDTVARVAKFRPPIIEGPRRPGDPPRLVASSQLIRQRLGWQPNHTDLESIVQTAWNWLRSGGRYDKERLG